MQIWAINVFEKLEMVDFEKRLLIENKARNFFKNLFESLSNSAWMTHDKDIFILFKGIYHEKSLKRKLKNFSNFIPRLHITAWESGYKLECWESVWEDYFLFQIGLAVLVEGS